MPVRRHVAPFTGAWIEIIGRRGSTFDTGSHPSRVRGLKSSARAQQAGRPAGRTLHGCVD